MGGDEFAVIVPGCDDEKVHLPPLRAHHRVAVKPIVVERMEHTVGASIGVALFPDDGQKVEELIMKADSAMYRAKEAGTGAIRVFRRHAQRGQNATGAGGEPPAQAPSPTASWKLHFQPKLQPGPTGAPARRRCCAGPIRNSARVARTCSCPSPRKPT